MNGAALVIGEGGIGKAAVEFGCAVVLRRRWLLRGGNRQQDSLRGLPELCHGPALGGGVTDGMMFRFPGHVNSRQPF